MYMGIGCPKEQEKDYKNFPLFFFLCRHFCRAVLQTSLANQNGFCFSDPKTESWWDFWEVAKSGKLLQPQFGEEMQAANVVTSSSTVEQQRSVCACSVCDCAVERSTWWWRSRQLSGAVSWPQTPVLTSQFRPPIFLNFEPLGFVRSSVLCCCALIMPVEIFYLHHPGSGKFNEDTSRAIFELSQVGTVHCWSSI